jgi:hypothetical protein
MWKRFPHWIAVFPCLVFSGLVAFCGLRDLIQYRLASPASVALWFMASGFVLRVRSLPWNYLIRNWKSNGFLALMSITGFATFYYPHIKPSWGGGEPVSATIYFAKDSPILPGRSVSAQILEETDSGLYVIGGGDKKATFIPRNAVAMVYYSDDGSGPFIMKTK